MYNKLNLIIWDVILSLITFYGLMRQNFLINKHNRKENRLWILHCVGSGKNMTA